MQNREKSCSKTCFFRTSNFMCFLLDFGSCLGSKNRLKIDIFRKIGGSKVLSEALLLCSCFLDGFRSPWSPILMDFGALGVRF